MGKIYTVLLSNAAGNVGDTVTLGGLEYTPAVFVTQS